MTAPNPSQPSDKNVNLQPPVADGGVARRAYRSLGWRSESAVVAEFVYDLEFLV